ncbi:hypothetical protein GGF46_002815 [Coemansia sp. RSA 552]|nr:hypothetical protein GGF46_002815 [Coemansia sp. RSA 552]
MVDKPGYRIQPAAAKDKYAVDTSVFDALVDNASSGSASTTPVETVGLKQRLLAPSEDDMMFLGAMLSSRLDDGRGEMVFETGKEEDGSSMDLEASDVDTVTATLAAVAQRPEVNAFVRLLNDSKVSATGGSATHAREIVTKTSKAECTKTRVLHYLVRRQTTRVEEMLEVRVAVVGNVDSGKSTTLGTLTQGKLDDGRGRSRLALFKHKHEIDSGRTSSVGLEILGFDKQTGAPVRHTDIHRKAGWDAVCERSSKIVAFLDLAGHEKYLKTTVFGMAGGAPDHVMLMVAANAGIVGMAKEHLGLALALGIPVFVVITKIDMCPPNILDRTLKQLTKLLRSSGCRKLPISVRDHSSVVMAASRCVSQRVCPVFQISNVTGEGIDVLQTFLNILPLSKAFQTTSAAMLEAPKKKGVPRDDELLHYDINETFHVPHVGTVVSGVVRKGVVRMGDSVWLGPDYNGVFVPTVIRGIQRKRVDVQAGLPGQSVSLAVKKISRSQVRKGMVVLGREELPHNAPVVPPTASSTFEAEVVVLYHSTTITSRYQAMVHCGSVRQTARVLAIQPVDDPERDSSDLLRTGDRARVTFNFIAHPEYLSLGSRLVFREGTTKGVGKVVRVLTPDEERKEIHKATGGSMVFDVRRDKIKFGSLHHKGAFRASPTKG